LWLRGRSKNMKEDLLKYIPNYNFTEFIIDSKITDEKLDNAMLLQEEYYSNISRPFIYDSKDFVLDEIFKNTIFNFNNEKDLKILNELNEIFREVNSSSKFYSTLEKITEIKNKYWLETEYNSALHYGSYTRDMHRFRKNFNVFPFFEYKCNCEFNQNHNLLNGIILLANSDICKSVYPFKNWKCNCYVSPRMEFEVNKSNLEKSIEIANEYILGNN